MNEYFSQFKRLGSKASFRKAGKNIVNILEQLPCYFLGRNSETGFKEVLLGVERILLRKLTSDVYVLPLNFKFEDFISNSIPYFPFIHISFLPMMVPLFYFIC